METNNTARIILAAVEKMTDNESRESIINEIDSILSNFIGEYPDISKLSEYNKILGYLQKLMLKSKLVIESDIINLGDRVTSLKNLLNEIKEYGN